MLSSISDTMNKPLYVKSVSCKLCHIESLEWFVFSDINMQTRMACFISLNPLCDRHAYSGNEFKLICIQLILKKTAGPIVIVVRANAICHTHCMKMKHVYSRLYVLTHFNFSSQVFFLCMALQCNLLYNLLSWYYRIHCNQITGLCVCFLPEQTHIQAPC